MTALTVAHFQSERTAKYDTNYGTGKAFVFYLSVQKETYTKLPNQKIMCERKLL